LLRPLRRAASHRILFGVRLLIALLAFLLLAAPAMAQEPAPTVGSGQVVTDPGSETEPPAAGQDDGSDIPAVDDGTPQPEPAPDASGRRGEVHVLDSARSRHAQSPSPAAVPAQSHAAAAPGRPAATTLPFTGVNAGLLALIGAALLGTGLVARRQLAL
jgi:hypothetical protein